MIWTGTLAVLGGFAFLAVIGRYNPQAALRQWEAILTPAGRRALGDLQARAQLDAVLATRAHTKALRALDRAELVEAVRLLDLAAAVIEEAVPDRLKRLRAMAVFCRMAAALLPLPPILPGQFRLGQLATLAGLAQAVHHVLVSTQERFVLRLALLAACYRLARRVVRRCVRETRELPLSLSPWAAFEAGLADLQALDREHVDTFRILLQSLAA